MLANTAIAIESAPQDTDLWMLSHFFSTNWAQPVTVRSSFETDIQFALTAAEQRRGLMGKPMRTVSQFVTAQTPEQLRALRMLMMRAAQCMSLFPLTSDFGLIDADVTSGATISVDTTFKRFKVGGRAVLVPDTSGTYSADVEVLEISAVTDTTITFTTDLVNDYNDGDLVFPLIEAQVIAESTGSLLTDYVGTLQLTAIEQVGDSQIDLVQEINTIPSGFSTHDSLPILSIGVNFGRPIDMGVRRFSSASQSGLKTIENYYGDRAAATLRLPHTCKNREEAWNLLKLFESRGGSLHPLWVVSPSTELTVLGVTGGGAGIVVKAIGPEYDWNYVTNVAIVLTSGTVRIRAVSSVSRNADEDTITFSATIPDSIGDIDRATLAFRARSQTDEFEERWATDGVMETDFSLIELIDEQEITIADLIDLATTDLLPLPAGEADWPHAPFYTDDRALQHTASGTTLRARSWDALGSQTNVEVLTLVIHESSDASSGRGFRVFLRGSGSTGTESAYYVEADQTNHRIELFKVVAGVVTSLGVTGGFYQPSTWFWVRLQAIGTAIKAKIWRKGETEPGAWTIEATDSSIAGAGWAGWQSLSGTGYLDQIGASTDADLDALAENIGGAGLYFESFEAMTVALAPTGWSVQWAATVGTYLIDQTNAAVPPVGWNHWWSTEHAGTAIGPAGGPAGETTLNINGKSGASVEVLAVWIEKGIVTDLDMTVDVFTTSVVNQGPRIIIRASGQRTTENGYVFCGEDGSAFQFSKIVNGVTSLIATEAFSYGTSVWCKIRVRASGSNFKAKMWLFADPEPADWMIDEDDATFASGLLGVGARQGNIVRRFNVVTLIGDPCP